MATTTTLDARGESFFRSESTRSPNPPPASPQQHSQPQPGQHEPQPAGQPQEPESRLPGIAQSTDKIVCKSTNYSVAPGPAWIEFTNAAAQGAGDIKGHIPLWGSGQMLAALRLPLACVVIKPTITPAILAAQKADAQKQQQKQQEIKEKDQKQQQQQEQKQKEQDKSQKGGKQSAEPFVLGMDINPAHAGMAVETQARQNVDDTLRAAYQEEISTEVADLQADQPRLLTPEEQALTGMSPSGFPGLLPGLRQASALPAGLGVQGVAIDESQSPAEITVKLVGSGQVPANSRWLIFTITGA